MIPLIDLKAQYQSLKPEIDGAVRRVLGSGQYILGHEVAGFEAEMAAYLKVKYAIGVSSGSEALYLALLACGIKEGDEVITSPFTFIATASAIVRCGARPVFADVQADTLNLDASMADVVRTPATKAILPVHLYGRPCDLALVETFAKAHHLKVIEDCAQALGATYDFEFKVGTVGDAGCYSFFPTKNLGACGDGGMVVTDDTDTAKRLFLMREHGAQAKYYYNIQGFNSRLDALQAAILRVKLKHLTEWLERRLHLAALYADGLSDLPWVTPVSSLSQCHSYNYYTVRVDQSLDRGIFRQHLESKGIASAVYYPLSLHLQKVYQSLGYKWGDFPVAEKAQREVVSLPMYPEMTDDQVGEVTDAVRSWQ